MRTPTSFKGHPLHPIMVSLPIGLFIFSLVSDCIYLARWGGEVWSSVALYTMGGGIVGALLAAVPGLIDLTAIEDREMRKTGITHMTINLLVVITFVVNWYLRYTHSVSYGLALFLSVVGVVLMMAGGWLGAHLVHVDRLTVEESPRGSK